MGVNICDILAQRAPQLTVLMTRNTSNSTGEAGPVSLNSAAKRKKPVDKGDNEASNKKPKKRGPPKGTKYIKWRLKRGLKLDYNQKVEPPEKRKENSNEVKKRLWTKATHRLFTVLGKYGITGTREGVKVITEGKRKEVGGKDTKDILRNAGRMNKLAKDEGFSGENASTAFFERPMLCMESILKGARKENHVAIVIATGDNEPRYRVRGVEGSDLSDLNPAGWTQFYHEEDEDGETEENGSGDTGATNQVEAVEHSDPILKSCHAKKNACICLCQIMPISGIGSPTPAWNYHCTLVEFPRESV
jgi:hypothetical protein